MIFVSRPASVPPPLGRRELGAFANLNFSVMNVRERLFQVAHVKPLPAAGAFHEMIGLGFSNSLRIAAGLRPLSPNTKKHVLNASRYSAPAATMRKRSSRR